MDGSRFLMLSGIVYLKQKTYFFISPFGPRGNSTCGINQNATLDMFGIHQTQPDEDISTCTYSEADGVFEMELLEHFFHHTCHLVHRRVHILLQKKIQIEFVDNQIVLKFIQKLKTKIITKIKRKIICLKI